MEEAILDTKEENGKKERNNTENKKEVRTLTETIQYGIETLLRCALFWESDDKKIGIMIQMIHHGFIYGMILWYIYLHTFSHSYLQFVAFYFIFVTIWIQHLFCGGCLFFNIEQKLIGNHPSLMDNLISIFHITSSECISNGILLMISSLIMAMLTGELLSRTIVGLSHLL